jgi:sulfur carrier protein ThiS
MQVLFINNSGAGFADYVDVAAETTIDKFIAARLPAQQADDLLIRVNRQPVPRDYVLQEGDRVSATPTKIQGAAGTPIVA